MTQEQKAKAYDEAVENSKVFYAQCKQCGDKDAAEILESIFPELKVSEDERIRKNCIHFLELQKSHHAATFEIEECIAWLEKQGEQETACDKCRKEQPSHSCQDITELGRCYAEHEQSSDKVEPKFKIGDFIVSDYCMGKVIEPTNDAYLLDSGQGIPFSCEHNAHLWTIQDAKDGDVLCYEDEVFILKYYALYLTIVYHCCYDGKNFIPHSIYSLTKDDFNKIHPATKEQRDTLMKAMTDAGYAFNFEKKELKKV